jgi:DNA-binding NarL/FixJ family response regulator
VIDQQTQAQLLMVEDHPLFVRAMQDLLKENYPRLRVHVAPDCAAACDWLLGLKAPTSLCAVLCDLDLPDANGVQAVQRLRPLTTLPLWVLSAEYSQTTIAQVLACGANGFISKRSDTVALLHGLKSMLGEPAALTDTALTHSGCAVVLSASQQRVADKLVLGLSNKEIAATLYLGVETVKSHVSEIISRLQARSRTEAVLKLMQGRRR